MLTTLKAANPEDIVYEVRIAATAGEWARLKKQLDQLPPEYPALTLRSHLSELLLQAHKNFSPERP